jgi:uncharacterized protein with GYD domain
MTNLQLFVAAGLPTLAVLIGILLNQRNTDSLGQNLGARLDRVEGRLDRIGSDLRELYRTLGQHDARIDNLEKRPAR